MEYKKIVKANKVEELTKKELKCIKSFLRQLDKWEEGLFLEPGWESQIIDMAELWKLGLCTPAQCRVLLIAAEYHERMSRGKLDNRREETKKWLSSFVRHEKVNVREEWAKVKWGRKKL